MPRWFFCSRSRPAWRPRLPSLDLPDLLEKKKTLLWRTRMSSESFHDSLPESIGVLLASATPDFAREAAVPVFINEADRRKANVEIVPAVIVPEGSK